MECDVTFRMHRRAFDGGGGGGGGQGQDQGGCSDDDVFIDGIESSPNGTRVLSCASSALDDVGDCPPPISDIRGLLSSLFYTTDDDILIPQ